MSNGEVKAVVVTVSPDHLSEIDTIAADLTAAGIRDPQVLSTLGIITGKVDEDKFESLRSVSGVRSIEKDEPMHAI